MSPAAGGWHVRRWQRPGGRPPRRAGPRGAGRSIWLLEAESRALVLGSTQRPVMVDAAAALDLGVDIVRRRSGGGVVLVEPATTVWIDVILPAGDPLWDDDVGRAAGWVGRSWQAALASLGVGPTEVHEGALACGPLGRLVCFATVGAGEVTTPERRKLVGISQRRTRDAARFQCAAYSRWEPEPLVRLLGLDGDDRRAVEEAAAGAGHRPEILAAAFLAQLPA